MGEFVKEIKCQCGHPEMVILISHGCGTTYWCSMCGAICDDRYDKGTDYKWKIPEVHEGNGTPEGDIKCPSCGYTIYLEDMNL